MMGRLIKMEDHHKGITYMNKIKEQGLRAWRISATLWLCVIAQNKATWFLSQRGKSKIITKKEAEVYLNLV